MPQISKKFPGKSAGEIYEKVDSIMQQIAHEMRLDYQKDAAQFSGAVSKMGVTGAYQARDGEVTIDLSFPMLIPGAMRQKVQADIERKLDKLFA